MIGSSNPSSKELLSELVFSTSRSSGPGGQNVNKVNSKVTLKWDILSSSLITDEQRQTLKDKLSSRLTKDGALVLTAQDSRSQSQNKQDILSKLDDLLALAFRKVKVRKATKPSKTKKLKRLDDKRQASEKKMSRRKID